MSDTQVTGWVGWGWFAGIVLLIAGIFDAVRGLIALLLPRAPTSWWQRGSSSSSTCRAGAGGT